MGFFYDTEPVEPALTQAFTQAFAADSLEPDEAGRAAAAAAGNIRARARPGRLHTTRLVVSVILFGLLLGGGVATEATGLGGSSQALFGFAGSVFGVVVGVLGSEKSAG